MSWCSVSFGPNCSLHLVLAGLSSHQCQAFPVEDMNQSVTPGVDKSSPQRLNQAGFWVLPGGQAFILSPTALGESVLQWDTKPGLYVALRTWICPPLIINRIPNPTGLYSAWHSREFLVIQAFQQSRVDPALPCPPSTHRQTHTHTYIGASFLSSITRVWLHSPVQVLLSVPAPPAFTRKHLVSNTETLPEITAMEIMLSMFG